MTHKLVKFVFEGDEPQRLDSFLARNFANDPALRDWTRSQIKSLIAENKVRTSLHSVVKPALLLKHGTEVIVELEHNGTQQLERWDFDLPIIFEDDDLIVINKPCGISMHPGAGEKRQTVINALASHFSAELSVGEAAVRAGVVHRLDKDTTGVAVIAKKLLSHSNLSAQFQRRSVKKTYLALALTTPRSRRVLNKEDSGTISAALGRHPSQRTKMAVVDAGGRHAVTHWKIVERMHYGCLLEIDLATGRTHQIRVHFDSIGSPLIGDVTYGDFSALPSVLSRIAQTFGRQALHAQKLEFDHPRTSQRMSFTADLPEDFQELLREFREFRN